MKTTTYSLQTYIPLRHLSRLALFLLLIGGLLAGCKSSKQATAPEATGYLSAAVRLTLPYNGAVFTVDGTLKLQQGERMQLSFLMPLFRTEVARVEATPDELLLVDRMGKRYVRATRQELEGVLPRNASFARLEKVLYEAARPEGKKSLTGSELGIPSFEKAQVELEEFSEAPFTLTPTQLSSKYKEVSLEEMLQLLLSLTR
ncbi:MAG: DUF4292 domain-containing protein [Bacteroides sp.]|nr:DUF4292 domain-containing protein [Bacteroides sp.]